MHFHCGKSARSEVLSSVLLAKTSTSILETRKTGTSPALTISNLYSYDLMEKTKAKAYQIMEFNLIQIEQL